MVWNIWIIFTYIGNVIIPTDFHIFQRGRYTINQHIYMYVHKCAYWFVQLYRNYPKLGTKPSSTGWDALGASHHQPPWDHRSKTPLSPFKTRWMCSTCDPQELKNCGWDIAKKPFINQQFWMAKAQSKIMGCLPSINWFTLRISLENADPLVISYSLRHRKWPSRNT